MRGAAGGTGNARGRAATTRGKLVSKQAGMSYSCEGMLNNFFLKKDI